MIGKIYFKSQSYVVMVSNNLMGDLPDKIKAYDYGGTPQDAWSSYNSAIRHSGYETVFLARINPDKAEVEILAWSGSIEISSRNDFWGLKKFLELVVRASKPAIEAQAKEEGLGTQAWVL